VVGGACLAVSVLATSRVGAWNLAVWAPVLQHSTGGTVECRAARGFRDDGGRPAPILGAGYLTRPEVALADDILSLREAAVRTGMSASNLRLLARLGRIKAKRIGSYWVTTAARPQQSTCPGRPSANSRRSLTVRGPCRRYGRLDARRATVCLPASLRFLAPDALRH
jgi:hypothetical protein